MQCGIAGHDTAEVMIQDGKDVVRYLGMHGVRPGPCPFELLAAVGPEGEVGVDVVAVLFRWEQSIRSIVEA